ncbi:MAG: single-stranded-DNA-specific exonuclease RecJ [Candidatus Portnoybacteria bacterium CG06_land_8_20_14_3_00_39_12]|uniref:Single-stranded-DNA-specific exonuclease RecJ n=1 Tax=Candidatus Portnoybacteria bacterium CG06_land_8_20_14_3_00_39_12 TaxID=1974809 RepID=A0A2M7AWC4_9BACT|nr:MAG: single-stranded-DNA-specific exonuclease RecJ [Candidatus Portnoybacteria bacterium CG06_land_8_20_14_3_00_39_12]
MNQWSFKPGAPQEFKEGLSQYPSFVLDLLYQRGLKSKKDVGDFLKPDYEKQLNDPLLMRGMDRAVGRIVNAIKKEQKVAIFGDYDTDGVCGAAVLNSFFNLFDFQPEIYIPGRVKEGYGLNCQAIEHLADKGVKLAITVDCGVTDFAEIDLANKLGMDVIVLDHHYVEDRLPNALAVVDPWQRGCDYPFKNLAGVGVAFKAIQALLKSNFAKKNAEKIPVAFDKWLLDLVALGTVVDCMPLLGENRVIVKYGLVVLAQSQRPGIRALMNIAGVKPIFDSQNLTTNLDSHTLGYALGPRLNAAGRMSHANMAYELLICQSDQEAEFLAKRLDEKNQERQAETSRVLAQVEERLKKIDELPMLIFEGDESWSIGINGLVAGKLSDKYFRPAFIYKIEGENVVGSARSIPGFNIIKALTNVKDYLSEFGGHSGAAGFSTKKDNLTDLKNSLEKIINKEVRPEALEPQLNLDLTLSARDISWQTYGQLRALAPFGQANPEPICCLNNVEIINLSLVGNGSKHLRLDLRARADQPGDSRFFIFRAVGFNFSDWAQKLKLGDKIDVAFELMSDDWRGPEQVQLKLVDLRISTGF